MIAPDTPPVIGTAAPDPTTALQASTALPQLRPRVAEFVRRMVRPGLAGRGVCRIDPNTGELLSSLKLPDGMSVSGLEAERHGLFYCGGGRSGKIRAVRRPNSGAAARRPGCCCNAPAHDGYASYLHHRIAKLGCAVAFRGSRVHVCGEGPQGADPDRARSLQIANGVSHVSDLE